MICGKQSWQGALTTRGRVEITDVRRIQPYQYPQFPPSVLTGLRQEQDSCRFSFVVSPPLCRQTRRNCPQRTYLSLQQESCTSINEIVVIQQSCQLFAGIVRNWRHHCQGRHGYYEFQATSRTNGIRVRAIFLDSDPTLCTGLRLGASQGNIQWMGSTVYQTKYPNLLG